jgi:hypothetical protein
VSTFNVPNEVSVVVGQGYDSINGTFRSRVLDPSCAIATHNKRDTFYNITHVTSYSELATSMSIGVSAAYHDLLAEASGSAHFLSTFSSSQYSVYLLIQARILRDVRSVSEYRFERGSARPDAARLTAAQFYRMYGDEVVTDVTRGGWLICAD